LEAFLNRSLRICLLHWWSFFLVKSKTFDPGTTPLKCWIIRISRFLDVGLKEFCCTYNSVHARSPTIMHNSKNYFYNGRQPISPHLPALLAHTAIFLVICSSKVNCLRKFKEHYRHVHSIYRSTYIYM
jgi:hypothetical protein